METFLLTGRWDDVELVDLEVILVVGLWVLENEGAITEDIQNPI